MFNVLLFLVSYIGGFILTFRYLTVCAFALYEIVYFMSPLDRWWGYMIPTLSYSYYVVLLMITAYLFTYRESSQNKLLQAPQFKWAYLIVIIHYLVYFWAVDQRLHLITTGYLLNLVIIISIAYTLIDTIKKLDIALYAYMFGAWYISFLTYQVGRNSGDRVEGIGTVDSPDSNGIAAAIAPTIVLCLYYFWTTKGKFGKFLCVVAGGFITNGLILINSRGAMLAGIAGIGYFMFYMFFSNYKIKYQKTFAITLVIIGLSGLAAILDESTINRFNSVFTTEVNTEQENGKTRTIFWKAAWDLSLDHPLGLGFKGFNHYSDMYIPESVNTGASRARTVHSTWFEGLTEVGFIGMFCFILMLTSSFKTMRRCKKILKKNNDLKNYYKIIAIEAAFFSFIIAMTFLNRFRAEILYWCILYTACAYNIYVLKPRNIK
jgi:hypothetical protein